MTEGDSAYTMPTDLSQLASLELGNIFYESFSARTRRFGPISGLDMQIELSYAVREGRLLYRFTAHCTVRGETRKGDQDEEEGAVAAAPKESGDNRPEMADIEVTLICEYINNSNVVIPEGPVLESFGEETVIHVAYPYLREAVSSMISRLGFPSITIGLPSEGSRAPNSAHGRRP